MAIDPTKLTLLKTTTLEALKSAPIPQGFSLSTHQKDLETAFDKGIKASNTSEIDDWIEDTKEKFPATLKKYLFQLIDGLDALTVESVAANNGVAVPVGVFTEPVLLKYNQMSRFGCEDGRTFGGHIKKGEYYQLHQVYNRLWRYANDTKYSQFLDAAKTGSPGALSRGKKFDFFKDAALGVYNNTVKAKNGICTTFGWAAGGQLMDEMSKTRAKKSDEKTGLRRIEVVGWRLGHVYVVVNRDGGFETAATRFKAALLPAKAKWGDDAIIVDVWLGSLGNESVFKASTGSSNKNNECFLEGKIESLFDSNDESLY